MTTRTGATGIGHISSMYEKYAHIERLPDPERVNDLEQMDWVVYFLSALTAFFVEREDVLISGEGYLCHEASGGMSGWLVPDCIVVFGVNPYAIKARNGYVINEIGKPPDFILEVGSRSTGARDYTVKREGYAGYGVREYWRFDHTGGDYHDAAIAGDLLVDGEYVAFEIIEEADGMKWGHSPVLGLDLCWVDKTLRIRIPETGEFLPSPAEWQIQTDVVKAERDDERAGRILAQTERDAEIERRIAAEAELVRLQEQLRRMQQD